MEKHKESEKAKEWKKREKAKELNEYKKIIYGMADPYLRDHKPENHGPLSFFQGLFTAHIAVSSKSRKGYPSFIHFLDEWFLDNDKDILSFFDRDQNMKAFQSWGRELLHGALYDESFGYPQFLLLEKARAVKDEALVKYFELADTDSAEESGEKAFSDAWETKENAYLKWLQAVAFFEICVRKYFGEILQIISEMTEENPRESLTAELTELTERIINFEIYEQMDFSQKKQWDQKTEELYEAYHKKYSKTCYRAVFFYHLWVMINDLFASIRILLLVEYVNVNTTERLGTENNAGKSLLRDKVFRTAYIESSALKKQVKKILQKVIGKEAAKNLFMEMLTWNRNYSSRYREMIHTAWSVNPPRGSTESGEMKEQVEWLDALREYFSILAEKYRSDNTCREKQGEKRAKTSEETAPETNKEIRLRKINKQLADPIWKVIDQEISK